MADPTWHVTPYDGEGWQVKKETNTRASSTHETKSDAVQAAKALAKKRTDGRVLVHKADGTVQRGYRYDGSTATA